MENIRQGRILFYVLKMHYDNIPEINGLIYHITKEPYTLGIGNGKISGCNTSMKIKDYDNKKLFFDEEQTKLLYSEMEKYYKKRNINNDDIYWVIEKCCQPRFYNKLKKSIRKMYAT